jgi:hypothetical protein
MRSLFFKEAKAAAAQVRSLAGCGGETNAFKRTNRIDKVSLPG